MDAFVWLNDLAQWLGRIFPRLTLIPPTHCGVVFGPHGGAVQVGCGLKLWWPMVQDLKKINIALDSMDIASVSCSADIGKSVVPVIETSAAVITWKVQDPLKVAINITDIKRTIDNWGQAAIASNGEDDLKDRLRLVLGIEMLSFQYTHTGKVIGVQQFTDFTNTTGTQESS